MNPWQLAQQMKHALGTVQWAGGASTQVFGPRGVAVVAGVPTEDQIPPGFPWALVVMGSGEPDEDDPAFITQRFSVVTGVSVMGDPLGEHAIIGGSAGSLTQSSGRGVAEVTERVRSAIGDLTASQGASIQLHSTEIDAPTLLGQGRHVVIDEHGFTGLCPSTLFYASPQQIAHSAGVWTWEGAHCSDRFDFLHYRLVRKSGSSASLNVEDGTTVYTGTAATFTGAQTGGNVYTCFAGYSARGQDTADDYSDPLVGSYLVAL